MKPPDLILFVIVCLRLFTLPIEVNRGEFSLTVFPV